MNIGYIMQLGAEVRRPPFDGPANHVRQVIYELKNLGHNLRLVIGLEGKVWTTSDLERYEPVEFTGTNKSVAERVVRRAQSALKLPYFGYFESRRFANACQKALEGVDILFERLSWMGYGGALAARSMNLPLVIEFNGDPLHDLDAKGVAPRGIQRRISAGLLKWSLNRASAVIATGQGWRNNLIQVWEVPSARIHTIENGTELVRLLKREDLRAFTPLHTDQPVTLAYLGGFYAWQGTGILLRAAQRLIEQGMNIRLIMIGSGADFQKNQQEARDLGIAERVTFTGPLPAEKFGPLLAQADIGTSPYCGWKEYSGLKLFDYKAAGLAIVASGEDGQPVTLKHGQTGWIVPPCDEDALTAALRQMILDAPLRQKLGQNARLEAESLHGWDHTARELEKTFREVRSRNIQ